MNAFLRNSMTLEHFLVWESLQEERYEFDGFGPVARTGGDAAHAAIQVNLLTALTSRLRGKRCRAYGSELKIAVAGRIRYPDAFLSCTPISESQTVLNEPVVVFEVLSEVTSNADLIVKNAEYRATPSIKRYVVLQRVEAGALVFSRHGSYWVTETLAGVDAVLSIPESEIEIPLSEIYLDLAFFETAPEPVSPSNRARSIAEMLDFDRVVGIRSDLVKTWVEDGRR